jgi:two-component system response regulator FixJ
MPITTVFIRIEDEKLEEKVKKFLQAQGLVSACWNARIARRNICGIACLITDHSPEQSDGMDQGISGLYGMMPSIVITPQGDVGAAVRAIKQGAFDVLEAPLNERALLSTVMRALEQGREASRVTDIIDDIRRRMAHLTAREHQILDLLVVGKTNKEAALKLDISVRTVEIHRAHVMEKMKARNMPQLVRMVIAAGERSMPSSPRGFGGFTRLPLGEAAFT